ncbi:hypothetical protein ACIQJT_26805 [Streptomyces sp. NPDC091972]|uniref:hypothetical protein n=1 Tax=Streptomyces sp. NPDC091972 TaxID=3366007 RepID=UPI0037F395BD
MSLQVRRFAVAAVAVQAVPAGGSATVASAPTQSAQATASPGLGGPTRRGRFPRRP